MTPVDEGLAVGAALFEDMGLCVVEAAVLVAEEVELLDVVVLLVMVVVGDRTSMANAFMPWPANSVVRVVYCVWATRSVTVMVAENICV